MLPEYVSEFVISAQSHLLVRKDDINVDGDNSKYANVGNWEFRKTAQKEKWGGGGGIVNQIKAASYGFFQFNSSHNFFVVIFANDSKTTQSRKDNFQCQSMLDSFLAL